MKLNEKIFEYRKRNNWSQEDLADKIDVSRQTVSKWETGKNVPELDKLIMLAELFNISVDTLVKEEIEINSDEDTIKIDDNINTIKEKFKDNKEFIKKLITAIVISMIVMVGYEYFSNKINLYKRENDIKEVITAYEETFTKTGCYYATEKYSKKENGKIIETNRRYYMYFESGKELVKVTEYEGNNSEKIIKEIYVDLTKVNHYDWITKQCYYDGVVEIYASDWSHKMFDNYEFATPFRKIRNVLDKNYYDIPDPAKTIAENSDNIVDATKFPKHNMKAYQWIFGDKNNLEKKDVMRLFIRSDANWMAFYSDDYNNDIAETREIVDLQISKVKGTIDDVTIPEL